MAFQSRVTDAQVIATSSSASPSKSSSLVASLGDGGRSDRADGDPGAPAMLIRPRTGAGVEGRPGVEPAREPFGVWLRELDAAAGVREWVFETWASSLALYAGRNASPGLVHVASVRERGRRGANDEQRTEHNGRGRTYGGFAAMGGRTSGWRGAQLPTASEAGDVCFAASISPWRRACFSRLRSALVFAFCRPREGMKKTRNPTS